MAWWNTQLTFKADTLVAEGWGPFAEEDFGLEEQEAAPAEQGEVYTRVFVSGYALYGELQGYYALGVARFRLDSTGGSPRYLSERSALHRETVTSLTPNQRAAIRTWLVGFSDRAWQNSSHAFRRSLDTVEPATPAVESK